MRTLLVVKSLSGIRIQQPLVFPVAVFLMCFSLSACAPKEKVRWADDKNLILQSLDDISQSQRLSKSNMDLLNQRMLHLEKMLAKQEATLASLKASLNKQKMKQIQWKMIQEQQQREVQEQAKVAPVKAAKKKVAAPAHPVTSASLAKKIKRIEKDIQQVSAVNHRDEALSKKSKEKDLYTAAYLSLKSGRYDEAILSFQDLLRQFPQGELVDQAYYWLGESFLSKGDFAHAIESFSRLVKDYPKSAKYQPALLRLAMAYQESKRFGDAKAVLQRLIQEYPDSRSAEKARTRLAALQDQNP